MIKNIKVLGTLENNPFAEVIELTVENTTLNPEIYYNEKGERVIVLPGKSAVFIQYRKRDIGKAKIIAHRPRAVSYEELEK